VQPVWPIFAEKYLAWYWESGVWEIENIFLENAFCVTVTVTKSGGV